MLNALRGCAHICGSGYYLYLGRKRLQIAMEYKKLNATIVLLPFFSSMCYSFHKCRWHTRSHSLARINFTVKRILLMTFFCLFIFFCLHRFDSTYALVLYDIEAKAKRLQIAKCCAQIRHVSEWIVCYYTRICLQSRARARLRRWSACMRCITSTDLYYLCKCVGMCRGSRD